MPVTSRVALLALVALLAGCTSSPTDAPTGAAPIAGTSTPAPTQAAPVFVQPEDCDSLVPQSRLDEFANLGLILLGGPGGKFGTEYQLEPTPEEQVGGITCIWGYDESDISSVTVSVAPLSADVRAQALDSFATQGLDESLTENIATYATTGDEDQPAIINVLREDNWISVIKTVGGDESATNAAEIAAEVAATVYR